MSKEEDNIQAKLDKLCENSKPSEWHKEAAWRERNEWWKYYWDRIYLKYLIIKRKFNEKI